MISVQRRVTILSPTASHPSDFGNRKRILKFIEAFKSRGFEISFVFYPLDADWREAKCEKSLAEMRKVWGDVELVIPSVHYHPASHGLDHEIDDWWDPAIENHLRWHFQAKPSDVFVVNYTFLSRALDFAPLGTVKILDTHDKFGGRRKLLASLNIEPEFFHTSEEQETIGLDRADIVIAIKDQEEDLFKNLTSKKVITVPFCDDQKNISSKADSDVEMKFGMIGAKNNINARNFEDFLDVAIPIFRENFAPLKICIAGSVCNDLAPYSDNNYIDLIGFVENVDDFYSGLDCVLVPMHRSSGQKIKTGEALATGLPVICHAHAFEGYVGTAEYHEFETFEDIAKFMVHLSFYPERLKTMRKDTDSAQRALTSKFSNSISTLMNSVRKLARVGLFVVSATDVNKNPALRAHILTMFQFVSSFIRVALVVEGRLNDQMGKFLTDIQEFGNVYVSSSRSDLDGKRVYKFNKIEEMLDIFNISLGFAFSNFANAFFAENNIQVYTTEMSKASIEIANVKTRYSAGNGAKIYQGFLEFTDGEFLIRDASEFAADVISPSVKHEPDSDLDEFLIISDKNTKDLGDYFTRIALKRNFKVTLVVEGVRGHKFESDFGLKEQGNIKLSTLSSVSAARPTKYFSKILNLSNHAQTRSARRKFLNEALFFVKDISIFDMETAIEPDVLQAYKFLRSVTNKEPSLENNLVDGLDFLYSRWSMDFRQEFFS